MSHSFIFQLTPRKPHKDEYAIDEEFYDDEKVSLVSDWISDNVESKEERQEAIESLMEMMRGFARHSKTKGLISINKDKAEEAYMEWYTTTMHALLQEAISEERSCDPLDAIMALEKFNDARFLFRVDYLHEGVLHAGMTQYSSQFVHDLAKGNHPSELYVASIIDFHY